MRNYGCCILKSNSSRRTAKLFDSEGNFQRLEIPVRAAELMLEAPGNVVCPVDELRRNLRVSALKPEQQLQPGKFYLMFPAGRVCTKVSTVNMKLIDAACSNKKMPRRPKVLFSPVNGDEDGKLVDGEMGFPACRRNCRQWRPTLEPIVEGTRNSKSLFFL